MKNFNGTRRILPLLVGALCLSSSGGSNLLRPVSIVWAEDVPTPTKPDMTLTEKDNGKTVKARLSQIIEVRLESNATTGYEWSVIQQDETALATVQKPKFIPPNGNRDGAPGQQVFEFKTLKLGETKLKLAYARSFETGKPPIKTFDVTIDIQ